MAVSALLVVAALASPVVPFEGRALYRFRSSAFGNGDATVVVGKDGIRSQLRLRSHDVDRARPADGRAAVVRLQRRGDADRVWLVDARRRAYGAVPAAGAERVRIEARGASREGGRACDRVVVTAASGARDELCVTNALGKVDSLAAFVARRPAAQAAAALAAAGLDGLPLRWQAFAVDGAVLFELELRSARRERVGPEPFRLPAGGHERPAAELPGAALDSAVRPPQTREERQRLQQLIDDVARRG